MQIMDAVCFRLAADRYEAFYVEVSTQVYPRRLTQYLVEGFLQVAYRYVHTYRYLVQRQAVRSE
jgi:hypothetical protein